MQMPEGASAKASGLKASVFGRHDRKWSVMILCSVSAN